MTMALCEREVTGPLSRARKVLRIKSGFRVTKGNITAIDFGTTFCTVAYTTSGNDLINILKIDGIHERVPTAILLQSLARGEYKVAEFGYGAQKAYSKMRASDRHNYIYFEQVKMILERDDDLNRQSTVVAYGGTSTEYYIVEVIAFILCHLKQLLYKRLDMINRASEVNEPIDFDWVITVPAIWKASGKRMMREAAYMAGLFSKSHEITTLTKVGRGLPHPDEVNPDKLSLALEPEAAAIYSQQITKGSASLTLSGNYMVVDVGGGTVDVTAQTEHNDEIEVVIAPTGNSYGGTTVNKAFSKLLEKIVGDEEFERFLTTGNQEKCLAHKLALNNVVYDEFEQQKIVFGENVHTQADFKDRNGQDKEASVTIHKTMIEFYGEEKFMQGTKNISGIQFEDDTLYITYSVMETFFHESMAGICACTIKAIQSLPANIDTIYLVGGFGGCKYVCGKVEDALSNQLPVPQQQFKLIVPPQPQLAIAIGATIWRRNPTIIKARKSDATYGIAINDVFDPSIHDQHYRFIHPDTREALCKDIFKAFLLKDERISTNEVYTTSLSPHRENSIHVTIAIYSTPNTDICYTVDKSGKYNVRKVGEVQLDLPNPDNLPRNQRQITVTMDFSGTEIQAKAHYSITGKEVKIVCDFLSVQN